MDFLNNKETSGQAGEKWFRGIVQLAAHVIQKGYRCKNIFSQIIFRLQYSQAAISYLTDIAELDTLFISYNLLDHVLPKLIEWLCAYDTFYAFAFFQAFYQP
jgi:hypothetical protein